MKKIAPARLPESPWPRSVAAPGKKLLGKHREKWRENEHFFFHSHALSRDDCADMQGKAIDPFVNQICTNFTLVDSQEGKMTGMQFHSDVPAPGPTNGRWDRRLATVQISCQIAASVA